MTSELGALFVETALVPIRSAAAHFCAGQISEGLEDLRDARLVAAVEAGIKQVAKRVGVSPSVVRALLPWPTLQSTLTTHEQQRVAACGVWQREGHHLGGFLGGIAEVTVNADHHDDAGFYLERLAEKLSRDPSLSAPLDGLSAEVTRWEELLRATGPTLDDGPKLRRAYIRKVALRVTIAAFAAAIATTLVIFYVSRSHARARVDEQLTGADPCLIEKIAVDDRARASKTQQSSISKKHDDCLAVRARDARVAGCTQLIDHTLSGALEDSDRALAGDDAQLISRVAERRMIARDLAVIPSFPCADVDTARRLWDHFVDTAASSKALWEKPGSVAPEIVEAIRKRPDKLAEPSRIALFQSAEERAERGVLHGDPDELSVAQTQCGLYSALGYQKEKWCTALDVALARIARSRSGN